MHDSFVMDEWQVCILYYNYTICHHKCIVNDLSYHGRQTLIILLLQILLNVSFKNELACLSLPTIIIVVLILSVIIYYPDTFY